MDEARRVASNIAKLPESVANGPMMQLLAAVCGRFNHDEVRRLTTYLAPSML